MDEHISKLIIGYLQKTNSQEETDAFYVWLSEKDDNKKLFFEIKAIYDACIANKDSHIDIIRSWEKLKDKRNVALKQKHIKIRRFANYAAVAIIAILLTSLFSYFGKQSGNIASTYIGGDGLEADVVVLPDGTKISLGSKTTFHYDPDFGNSKRVVYLSGEAYFEVAQQKKKPFIVKTNGQEITVLGTKFNVMSYPSDSLLTTTLVEGSIQLKTDNGQVILKPNQQFTYNRKTQRHTLETVDALQYTSWTNGYYYFHDQRLENILHRLSHIYGIEFTINSSKLKNVVFRGTFYRGQSINDIMNIINISIPIKYKIEDNKVFISE